MMHDTKAHSSRIIYNALCTIFLLFAVLVAHVSAQDFTIDRFHSDIVINEDSSFTVKETIAVSFRERGHGIYRDIPFRYTDERGDTIKTPLKVDSVTDDLGKDRRYRVSRKGNVVNIRIGDPNKYVNGYQTYVISYSVENALLFFEDHDELYWNVTGNFWRVPIRRASASVTLAAKTQSDNLWAACYTGVMGSKESACRFDTSHNSAAFSSTKNLTPREGMTIAFGWEKGLVEPPSAWKKFLWSIDLKENWVFFLPIFSLVFMFSIWRTRGRDPRVREAVTVRYEPPRYNDQPLTPGEAGTLIDEKLDSRDITSTIVGLAVKGYIKIEEEKKEGLIMDSMDYYLAKVKDADDALSPFERVLLDKIFRNGLPGRMISDLKNKFYTELETLRNILYGELVSKKYFLVSPDKVRKIYVAWGFVLMIFSAILLSWLTGSAKGMIAGALTALPVFAFAKVMPAKTKAGASAHEELLGFQEFMNRAEKDQIQRMRDKDLFSKFLPYAIALDVVDSWAKAFEGIYQEAPQWYGSQGGFRTFSPSGFSRSITSATSSLASAMYAAPRGSGVGGGGGGFSGGGGSSGGGFGGGGGGSW